jgi:hypothetical protein
MARKIRSKQGSAIYTQRTVIVEPVNGQIKEVRGLRRFLLRALEKVDGEWHLIAATHNLLKLFRYRLTQQQALVVTTGSRAMDLASQPEIIPDHRSPIRCFLPGRIIAKNIANLGILSTGSGIFCRL